MGRYSSLILASLLLLTACGGGQRLDEDVPITVSAIGPGDFSDRVVAGAVAQGLVRFDGAGQIEPGLAERWTVLDEGRSYIFRLREAEWADGPPVTAAEVVRSLRQAMRPEARNPLAPFLAVIDEIVEMTPQVIEVRLKRPRPDLLKLFAQPELAVRRPRTGDGSGPFRVKVQNAAGTLLATTLSPDGAPHEARYDIRLHDERAALALARFAAGGSDLVLGGTFADLPLLARTGIAPANLHIEQPPGLFGLAVVRREGFLADAQDRAAVAMAIDRAALTAAVHPDWTPAEALLPDRFDAAAAPALPAWSVATLEERRVTARARVEAWTRSHDAAPILRIALPAGPGATLVWGQIAASLRRIGVETQRVGLSDPQADLRLIDAVAPYDSGRWFVQTACVACSEDATALILAGREAPDLAARAQRIAEADAALTADTAFIPLARPLRWSLVTPRLTGWQRNSRAWHPLNHLRNEAE